MSRDKTSPSSGIPARGGPRGYADLAREVVSRNPDVIVAITNPITQAVQRGHRHNTDRLDRRRSESRPGSRRAWRVRAATSPASTLTRGTRSGGSACRSSRKPSLRHPRSRSWTCARSGKAANGKQLREASRPTANLADPDACSRSRHRPNISAYSLKSRRERPDAIIVHATGRASAVPSVDRRAGREEPLAGDVSLA